MKNILIIAGTGTMGVHVVNLLREYGCECWVTSRSKREDCEGLHYLQGTPLDLDFLKRTLSLCQWDAVIDFMYYGTQQFESVVKFFLQHTKQYIFISSARVYAETNEKITEETSRLLDVCKDEEYIKTDEYALAKAREEDILHNSGKRNWTIVRPYVTFGESTFQLSPIRKEYWLHRALKGKKILFSKDLAEKITTFTYGYDVARGIVALTCKNESLGETFHIASPYSQTWTEVLSIYLDVLEIYLGSRPEICYLEKWSPIMTGTAAQVKYDRLYNRSFDNTKLNQFINTGNFAPVNVALKNCLEDYLKHLPVSLDTHPSIEGMMDRVTGDFENIKYLRKRPVKDIVKYLVYRLVLKGRNL